MPFYSFLAARTEGNYIPQYVEAPSVRDGAKRIGAMGFLRILSFQEISESEFKHFIQMEMLEKKRVEQVYNLNLIAREEFEKHWLHR